MLLPTISPASIAAGMPVTSFNFLVVFHGVMPNPSPNLFDMRFQKVSGIDLTIKNLNIQRIGSKQVRMPSFPEHNNLILERAYIAMPFPLKKELETKFENLQFAPRNVHVFLLNSLGVPITTWLFMDAFPIRWTISDLDANQSALLIETLELSYSRFQTISL